MLAFLGSLFGGVSFLIVRRREVGEGDGGKEMEHTANGNIPILELGPSTWFDVSEKRKKNVSQEIPLPKHAIERNTGSREG